MSDARLCVDCCCLGYRGHCALDRGGDIWILAISNYLFDINHVFERWIHEGVYTRYIEFHFLWCFEPTIVCRHCNRKVIQN